MKDTIIEGLKKKTEDETIIPMVLEKIAAKLIKKSIALCKLYRKFVIKNPLWKIERDYQKIYKCSIEKKTEEDNADKNTPIFIIIFVLWFFEFAV